MIEGKRGRATFYPLLKDFSADLIELSIILQNHRHLSFLFYYYLSLDFSLSYSKTKCKFLFLLNAFFSKYDKLGSFILFSIASGIISDSVLRMVLDSQQLTWGQLSLIIRLASSESIQDLYFFNPSVLLTLQTLRILLTFCLITSNTSCKIERLDLDYCCIFKIIFYFNTKQAYSKVQ